MNARNELDQEIRERRGEVQSQERRLIQKEENLERKIEKIENKEKDLESQEKEIVERKQTLNETIEKQLKELQRISGLSKDEAKQILLSETGQKTYC